MVKLDILSDPVCSWCLIGKTRPDRALAAHPARPFAVEWHPVRLNPDMPAQDMDRRAYPKAELGVARAALVAGTVADARARRRGVRGVPSHVLAATRVLTGTQPPSLRDAVPNDLPEAGDD